MKERLLGEESLAVQLPFERLLEAGILGPELGEQIVPVLLDHPVEHADWMKAHASPETMPQAEGIESWARMRA